MKNRVFIITVLAALSLASCGKSETPVETNSTPTPVSTTTTSSTETSSNASSLNSSVTPIQQYTITFNSNGGSDVASITANEGTSITDPGVPTRQGYVFVGWSSNSGLTDTISWPLTLTSNMTLYASWNEKLPLKTYFSTLIDSLTNDPYGYIPDAMRPDNDANFVTANQVNYNFENTTQVSNIHYGGFGEQWNMVITNIRQSQMFYNVTTTIDTVVTASVSLFNNYFDTNASDTADHQINESNYTASVLFEKGVLSYSLAYKTSLSIPFFGSITPSIEMSYDIAKSEKTVRIGLTENNAMKYVVTDDSYKFAIQYGVTAVSRKAMFEISEDEEGLIKGSIYEFVQLKDKDLIPACAEFYIEDGYVTAVGNKASGMVGFDGYINELYEADSGKLLGYKVRETLKVAGVSGTYHTLWFNLNNISGITSVRAIANENLGQYGDNNHDIYLNGSSSIFTPARNSKLMVKTSRKYDVELRKQYFYGLDQETLTEYETSIPMMFIQDDNENDTNYSDFTKDMNSESKISGASVNLANKYLTKIRSDYNTYIDTFIADIEDVTGTSISDFIGTTI